MAEYFVGLMSGTSLDGVDAALAAFDDNRITCLAAHHQAFATAFRTEVLALHESGQDELHRAALLSNRLTHYYADAVAGLLEKVRQCGAVPAIHAIGCHGQTVRHAPDSGYTIQLHNPALLAELTGLTVVADFRSRDIAAGGQGAPLVPAFHDALFRAPDVHRIIINIGGIANLTDLAPQHDTIGFDCGPGNILLDAWCQTQHDQPYDAAGAWAATGSCLPDLLSRLMHHPFLALPPPKSCGRAEFNIAWLTSLLTGNERAEDVQATLAQFTAATVTAAVRQYCRTPDAAYICGGGARNTMLMRLFTQQGMARHITTTDALGLPAEHVEATAFAWLAWRTLRGQPGNLPAVTGAVSPRILGAIYLA